MQVTLAQLEPRYRDIEANLARTRELLESSGAADLVVLPELFLCGYALEDLEPLALDLDGLELGSLREAARAAGTAVIVGFAERTPSGVANTAACIDASGELAGVYRKTHLFGAERDVYVAGDSLGTIQLGTRTLGLMICFDMEFPEVARTLAAEGADLLVSIAANPPPFELDHSLFARTRALESGLPHVYVNQVGTAGDVVFRGESLAVDPDARVLLDLGADAERVASVNVGEPGRDDARTSYLDLLREELYRPGTATGPRSGV
jgi:predicted amidohydrolase